MYEPSFSCCRHAGPACNSDEAEVQDEKKIYENGFLWGLDPIPTCAHGHLHGNHGHHPTLQRKVVCILEHNNFTNR